MKDWVWNIFIMTSSLAFVELILPGKEIKKFLKLIFSIVILAVIISPFSDISSIQVSSAFDLSAFENEGYELDSESILKSITTVQTRQIDEIYKEKVDAVKQGQAYDENTGISLPLTDIHSIDEEVSK